MSVIRVGSNSKYADGWSNVFGSSKASAGKTAAKASKKSAKKVTKKAVKKKVAVSKKKR
jgi:hypothetical protein